MIFFDAHTHGIPEEFGVKNIIYRRDIPPSSGWFSIGIHPWYVPENISQAMDGLMAVAIHSRCVAIGEFGFDQLRGPEIKIQEELVDKQIKIAEHFQKPIILHIVKAFDQLERIRTAKTKKLIHGFNKSSELGIQLVNSGFHLSFGRNFFHRADATDLLEGIPFDTWLLETDDSTDSSIEDVYHSAAEMLNMSLAEFSKKKTAHALDFFNLPAIK